MALSTSPAWIQTCAGWEDRLEEHPIWAWQHAYEKAFDFGNLKTETTYTTWKTDDFTFITPTGKTTTGAEAWATLLGTYAPFSSHYHEPFFVVIFENKDGGYELFGCAKIFVNLVVPGEPKTKKDLEGRAWDAEAAGAFHFVYVKDETGPGGYKLKSERQFADSAPLAAEMIKRGMVTADDYLKMVTA